MTSINLTRHFESLLLAMVLAASGCGSDEDDAQSIGDGGGDDQYDADDTQNPDDEADAAADTDSGGQAGGGEESGGGGESGGGESGSGGNAGQNGGAGGDGAEVYGFSVRVPQYRTLTCQSEMGGTETAEELEADFLCTFDYAGESGHIYLKSKPIGCTMLMGPVVSFEIEAAQLALGGSISDLDNALYNRGGNHQNDSFEFDYQGKHLKYYHSSFGFGWRACQPMDCIQVFNSSADEDPIQDGCTAERTLPVVCSQIQEDGSFEELVDTFEPCPGDSNNEQPQG
ncbi:MAG: hypothetical protein JXA30_21840 [Deltaproteobacteria bacterium]|nr:hypothetical protein [Deltaproteobacteria bacterium]